MKFISSSLDDTKHLAKIIGEKLRPGDVIAFLGGMGVGKTTFTAALLEGLGFAGEVFSPTFALMNTYVLPQFSVYHFDWYRIHTEDDLYSTGFSDLVDGSGILLIEWSENLPDELPGNAIRIEISALSENGRQFIITGGDRFC